MKHLRNILWILWNFHPDQERKLCPHYLKYPNQHAKGEKEWRINFERNWKRSSLEQGIYLSYMFLCSKMLLITIQRIILFYLLLRIKPILAVKYTEDSEKTNFHSVQHKFSIEFFLQLIQMPIMAIWHQRILEQKLAPMDLSLMITGSGV